jgi:general secretion pathway protein D
MCNSIEAKAGHGGFSRRSGWAAGAILPALLVIGLLAVSLPAARGQATIKFNPVSPNPTNVNPGRQLTITLTVQSTGIFPPDKVVFTAPSSGWPAGAIINSNTGVFTWRPTLAQLGTTNLIVQAYELANPLVSAVTSFTVNVQTNTPVPTPPYLAPISDASILEGDTLTFTTFATNTDNSTNYLTFTLSGQPTGASITNTSPTDGLFSWTPVLGQVGEFTMNVIVTATNTSLSTSQAFTVNVLLTNSCDQGDLMTILTHGGSVLFTNDCTIVPSNTFNITADVTLDANSNNVVIAGNNLVRLFNVEQGGSLTLNGITLFAGRSATGGAINIMPGGSVMLNDCTLQGNSAMGITGQSGTAGQDDPNYGRGGGNALSGWPGMGGAICNKGTLEAYGCQFLTNSARGGDGGNGGNGGGGNYQGGNGGAGGNGALAYGGAIYNYGTLVLGSNCVFIGNTAAAGNGGSGGAPGGGVFIGYAGNGGSGSIAAGGAVCSGPKAIIQDCLFAGNAVVGGSSAAGGEAGGGYGVDGAPGGSSFGGAICMIGGSAAALSDCLFSTNTAFGGNGGDGGSGFYGGGNGGNGGDGVGGCLYNIGRVATVNCTFSGCTAVGGTNGAAGGGPFSGRSGSPGSGLAGRFTNIVNGLTVANPSLAGTPLGASYLPLIDPAATANPNGSLAAADGSISAASQAAGGSDKGGSSMTLAQANTTPAPNPAAPAGTPSAPGQVAPPLPAGSIGAALPGNPASTSTVPAGAAATMQPSPAHTNAPTEEMMPEGMIDFRNADLNQVLDIYSMLVNRTILRPATLPAPTIFLKTQGRLTMREGIQALDAVLALNGITMVNVGDKFVKAVPEAQSGSAAAPFNTNSAATLPDLGQYVTHVVQLKYAKPSEVVPVLQPFVKIPNAILPVDTSQILVLRDYAENVKRMLELVDKLDVAVPSEFEQEVIPIKYAKASEIAGALNSLSTGGGGGTSLGGTTGGTGRTTSTRRTTGGVGGYPGATGATPFGAPGAVGPQGTVTPGATGSSFTQRLQNIINRASSATGDIQVLGQTKIISDERTNSLLIFATRDDMKKIKEIISKLDIVLAQVLIEAVIIEVTLTDSHDLGFSYLQHPQNVGNWTGVGALNNKTFQSPSDFILNGGTNGAGIIPGGFSYLMSFNQDLDIAVQAAQANSRARILQRPRIQTSHNEPASLFVGESRPYPTSSYYGGGAYGGYSSIQQLQIGVSLDVTPLINPDGLVVMDIHQKIDSFEGNVTIDNVGDVPITSEKEAQAKVSVRDHDTIILGGLIETDKNSNKSGLPFLMDLPLLGYLFRSSHTDGKRTELIVLIRPTVLPTPEIAALTATAEKNKMSGVRQTEKELRSEEVQRLRQANEEEQRNQPQPTTPP